MHRRLPIPVACAAFAAFAALVLARQASAAGPTIQECLAASDASLKAATDNKLRDERAQLVVCADASCPAPIRKECLSHVDEVNAQIPTLIVAAKDAAGVDLTAVTVSMDGEPLTDTLGGTALAVDPGEHTFTFDAAGQARVTKTLLIQEAQKDRSELVTFATTRPLSALAVRPTSPPSGLGTQKILALVAGGVGVVALGVGTAFGAMALSQKNAAQAACPAASCPTAEASSKWSAAASSGNVSTVGLIVGGVGVVAAPVLWFTAPRKLVDLRAQVGLGPGLVQLRGAW